MAGVSISGSADFSSSSSGITGHSSDSSETITLSNQSDIIFAGGGDDIILGMRGNDYILGGRGNDTIYGGTGNDVIWGGVGDDIIYGDRGDDIIFGDKGKNTLYGANDTYSGTSEDGNDTFVFNAYDSSIADADVPQDTIIDKGGSNTLLCKNITGLTGSASFVGDDLYITFYEGTRFRGSITIKQYRQYPFASIQCGNLSAKVN
jgi:Ca2+-binding RTX toxin-like protein